jgi:phage terminase large subunit GpA-like protein
VHWEGGSQADASEVEGKRLARYRCAYCDALWDDGLRDQAVKQGEWHAVEKEAFEPAHWDEPFPKEPLLRDTRPISIGWHLAGWYSPLVSLSKAAADFLRANQAGDPVTKQEKQRAWTNNFPAKPWIEQDKPEVREGALARLSDGRKRGQVPEWGLVLVLTADVQGDGVWWELRAWGSPHKSALVDHGFLQRWLGTGGDFGGLQRLLEAPWYQADGTELSVFFALVDARYRGDEVYDWCRRVKKAAPAMGYETRRTPIGYAKVDVLPGSGKAIPGGVQRVEIDTNHFKTELARRLDVGDGEEPTWLVHGELTSEYESHYRAEARDLKTGMWKQVGSRANHLWDCGVYQLAAARVLEAQGVFARFAAAPAVPEAPAPEPVAPRRRW